MSGTRKPCPLCGTQPASKEIAGKWFAYCESPDHLVSVWAETPEEAAHAWDDRYGEEDAEESPGPFADDPACTGCAECPRERECATGEPE